MADNRIPLADVLQNISAELHQADQAARDRGDALMKFRECELEFAIEVETEAKGGIKVWVLQLTAGRKQTRGNTIRIKYSALHGPPQAG